MIVVLWISLGFALFASILASKLKAKSPETITKRLKMFVFGESGGGKTMGAIQFPNPYVIDAERGAENEEYVALMKQGGAGYMQSIDSEEVIEQVRALATEPHNYCTIVIDPITTIESDLVERAERTYGPGDMRIWSYRDRQLKRLTNLLYSLDMNVVLTAHGKIDYGPNMTRLGTTYDGWKRWIYAFDLALEVSRIGKKRIALVRKTRLSHFPDGETFEFSYATIASRFPAGSLERNVEPQAVATDEQVRILMALMKSIVLPDGIQDKWLSKAGVECLEDMPAKTIQACIEFVKSKAAAAATGAKNEI